MRRGGRACGGWWRASLLPYRWTAPSRLKRKAPARESRGLRVPWRSPAAIGLAEQLQGRLGLAVGQRQHVGGRRDQDLRPGQGGRLRREVSVADDALGRGGVLDAHAEAADGGADRVLLEGAEPAAERADLLDGLGHDLLAVLDVAVDDVVGVAGGKLVEEADRAVAELAGGHVLDAQRDLARDV